LLGLVLVIASLSVLVLLFGQLVGDGAKRLVATHEVNREGFAPGRYEIAGVLKREAADDGQWFIARDPLILGNAADVDADLQSMAGRQVIVTGDVPSAGVPSMEARRIELAASSEPESYSRDALHGTLIQSDGQWMVRPTPLPLDVGSVAGDLGAMVDQRVAVDPGRARQLPLPLRTVEPLQSQTFFGSMPSREAARAGIKSPLVGSILVVTVTMLLALPLGVAAGIYLEEYGRKNLLTALIEINIANLAGVPSIIWGLMALGLLVYYLNLGRSVMAAGITLGLLVLPIVIMATRESIRAIPGNIREASFACGASKWQTMRFHIIPYSMGGILTGAIIGLSRAVGETAPLITIGALTYVPFLPDFSWSNPLRWLSSQFTVLPIQMFNWMSRPDPAFHANAAAAGIVLLALTLSMNAVAIFLRYRLRKSIKW
jgi:phosphate transport system permease protein